MLTQILPRLRPAAISSAVRLIGRLVLVLALGSTLASSARAQLKWTAYNNSGNIVGTQYQAASFDPATGTYTFTVPAAGQYTFVATNFVPIAMSAPATGTTIQTIAYKFKSSAGWTGAVVANRVNQLGLFNYGSIPPDATKGNFSDDYGLFGDLKGGVWGDEVFGGTPSAAGLLGGFQSAIKLSSGKSAGTNASWTLVDDTFVNITLRIALTSSGAFSLGTASSYANAGLVVEDSGAVGAGTSYQAIYSGPAASITAPNTFNEFAFYFRNDASTAATLTLTNLIGLTPPPYFAAVNGQPPATLTGSAGDTLSIAVSAIGSAITYQWQKSTDSGSTYTAINAGANASAATATLVLTNAQASDAGLYRVVISNAAGSNTSNACSVTIAASAVAPAVLSDPQAATILVGGSNTFTVSASGTAPLGYQWQKSTDSGANWSDINGAMSSSYVLSGAQLSDTGRYRVVVSNAVGSATSNSAALTVEQTPVFATQPTGGNLNPGDSLTLTAAATGTPLPTYQWKLNNVAIPGATGASYLIANASGAATGNYTVVATNDAGATTSSIAVVNVFSTSLAVATLAPTAGATGIFPDQALTITFNQPIAAGLAGSIKIFDVANPSTPVDTIGFASATARTASTSRLPLPVQTQTIGGQAGFNYYPITISGSTLKIYPRNGVLAYNKTYYVTIDPGAIVDASGGSLAGISDNSTWTFTTKASGPTTGTTSLVVAADGTGDFCTVQGALDFIPASNTTPTTIYIKNGTYYEIVSWTAKSNLTFVGQSRAGVVIGYPNNNNFNPTGTAWRAAFTCRGGSSTGLVFTNLSIRNFTAKTGSQAEALYLSGSPTAFQVVITNVSLYSYQDTLQINGQAYIANSYIEGDTDFMWGNGPVYFTNCELKALSIQSYYTQIRNPATNHGFVYANCTFDAAAADSQNPANPVSGCYLGRLDQNANPHTEVVLINGLLGDHILPVGWNLNGQTTSGISGTDCVESNSRKISDGSIVDVSQRATWSYQWTSPTNDAQIANYSNASWVLNTDMSGNVLGSWAPALAPIITTQPVDTRVVSGLTASFSVGVSALPAPTYQWQKDGQPITGATSATYSIATASASDAGAYTVVVTNSAGSVTSMAGNLTITAPADAPIIGTQPQSQTANVGASVSFSVIATGTAPLSYQWHFGGNDITGATSGTLNLTSLKTSDAGSYTVTVSNGAGSILSDAAVLTVITPPAAPAASAATAVTTSGFAANWSASAGATGYRLDVSTSSDFSTFVSGYQNLDVGGALTQSVTGLADNTTYYFQVRAVNSAGSSSSSNAISVATLPAAAVITQQPASQSINLGSSVTFTVVATSSTNLTYQWQVGGQNVTGATSASLTLPAVQSTDAGSYTVIVTNAAGSLTSNAAVLTVITPPAAPTATAATAIATGGFTANWGSAIGATDYRLDVSTSSTFADFVSGYQDFDAGSVTSSAVSSLTAGTKYYYRVRAANAAGTSSSSNTIAVTTIPNAVVISIHNSGSTGGNVYSLGDAAYTQNFDTLPSSGNFTWFNGATVPGWYAAPTTGTLNTAAVTADGTGNLNDQTLASVGTASNGDRALAYHTRLNTTPTYVGLAFSNDSGRDINGLTLAYTAEQWKESNSARNLTFTVQYRVGAALADLNATTGWTTINGLGASSTGSATTVTPLTASAVPVTVPAGSTIWFRWVTSNNAVAPATSSNDILAIDNVSVSFTGVADGSPAITTPPAPLTVSQGDSATFTVVATGDAPLTYQWRKDGTAISGATDSSYAIAATQPADAGAYSVVVTNGKGSATSSAATLTVNVPTAPSITAQPQSQTASVGGNVSFSVVATGSSPLGYQWKHDGNAIGGATAATLSLTSVQLTDAGAYTVDVTNNVGSVTSNAAALTVQAAPTITTQPVARTVTSGANVTFTVVASGATPLSYQWFKGSTAISSATAATLALTNVQVSDSDSYSVTVTNSVGSVTSNAVALVVNASLPVESFNLTGFATQGSGTTGGGVIPDTDPAYRKCYTPQDFVQAINDSSKTAGAVKVIEIMNDLSLGWNEVGATVQAIGALRTHAAPKLHPVLLVTGMSLLDIKAKTPLTIFSANGATIKHVNFNIKGTTNVVIRNLKFDENWEWDEASKGNYDVNDWDFITISNGGAATNIWIDHCTFTKSYDGIVDQKASTQYVTLSWCKYIGDDGATNSNSWVRQQIAALEANRASYPFYNFLRTNGFSVEDIVQIIQGHDKTHLMGSNDLDPGNATLSATFHHLWINSVWDRCVPRLRAGNVHVYNVFADDTNVLAAKRLRDTRANAMSTSLHNTLNNTYSFNPPINGCISTEGGALLLEKSIYQDCLWPLRNNQTDPSNPAYTGKIEALDTIYIFHNTDSTVTTIRGNSTDQGSPMGPFQAPIIPFSWNSPIGSQLPYSYTMDDPAQLPAILAAGAGAGTLTWSKDNWLRTTYVSGSNVAPSILGQPQSQTVATGNAATFTVQADGSGTLTYQWTKDGSSLTDGGRISGSATAALTVSPATVADAGNYVVTVTNSVGNITSSTAVLTVIQATAPTITTQPLTQTAIVGNDVLLSVVAGGTGPFTYQWSKDGSALVGATGSTLTLSAAQVSDGGSYTVVVTNDVGSITSNAAVVTVGTIPAAPVAVAATSITAAGFTANWNAVDGATGYRIDVSISSAFDSFVNGYQDLDAGANLSVAVTGLSAGTTYYYRVRADNAIGTSDASNTITAMTGVLSATPVSVAATNVLAAGFTANWNAATDATGYRIDVSTSSAFGSFVSGYQDLDAGANLSVAVTGLMGGTTYYYRVRAYNAFGTSDSSNTTSVTTGVLPGAPIAVAATTIATTGFSANWNAVTGATGYRIDVSTSSTFDSFVSGYQSLDVGASVSTNVTGLSSGTNYYYRVRAYNGFGAGSASNVVPLTTQAIFVPPPPTTILNETFPLADATYPVTATGATVNDGLTIDANGFPTPTSTQAAWATLNASSIAYLRGTSMALVAGSTRGFVAYFEPSNTLATLAVGETLMAKVKFSFSNGTLAMNPGNFRLALLNSGGNGTANNIAGTARFAAGVSNSSTTAAASRGYSGYIVDTEASTSATTNTQSFWLRTASTTSGGGSAQLVGPTGSSDLATSSTFSLIGAAGGGSAGAIANDGTVYTATITIARTSASQMDLSYSVASGGTTVMSYAVSQTSGTFATSFDSFVFFSIYGPLPTISGLTISKSATATAVAPSITIQPSGQTAVAGDNVVLAVAATGTAPLSYQWSKDSSAISGATSSTLVLSSVTSANAGSYTVKVTNTAGSVTSNAAVLVVNTPPTITTQPINQTVTAGDPVTFAVVASGTAPLTYQWQHNGVAITGATAATLTLNSVQIADAGSYTVVVSNVVTSITSATATLNVTAAASAPSITTAPQSQSVTLGGTTSFSVVADGTAPLTYQWSKNGSILNGATGSTLVLTNVQPTDGGSYTVTVTNAQGSATSDPAVLTVNIPAPVISLQPQSQSALTGTRVSFSVYATGYQLSYQWNKNGTPIGGATGVSLSLAGLQSSDAANYTVTVSNGGGSITSSAAALTLVTPAAALPMQPSIPTAVFKVTDYGAVGDGTTDNTTAIKAAITAALTAGGGIVEITPASGAYLCGPITLGSKLNLQIDGGATLRMLPYGTFPANQHFISVPSGATDLAITGTGTIEGDGSAWWTAYNSNTALFRPRMIQSSRSTNFYIGGITLQNSPMFHIAFSTSASNVTMYGLTITAPSTSPNTDGMDPAGSTFLIQGCNISVGDDNIAVKADSACSNFTIADCTFGAGHGLSVGGQTNTGLNGMNVMRCTFNGTSVGLRLKADATQGGPVQNLTYSDLTMTNVPSPIVFYSYYDQVGSPGAVSGSNQTTPTKVNTWNATPPDSLASATIPTWKNITIHNLTATGATAYSILWGLPLADGLIANVTLDNVSVTGGPGLEIYNATNVQLTGTTSFSGITTANALAIVGQPQAQTVAAGGTATFTVTSAGTSGKNSTAPTYQWSLNGKALTDGAQVGGSTITGSTMATLTVSNLDGTNIGNYTCTVSNNLDGYNVSGLALAPGSLPVAATSSAAMLTVTGATPVAPIITAQPQSQTVPVGTNVTLQVSAFSTTDVTYQWQHNGSNITGATSTTLSLSSVQPADAGTYEVLVTNAVGTTTSDAATLTVKALPANTVSVLHDVFDANGVNVGLGTDTNGFAAPTATQAVWYGGGALSSYATGSISLSAGNRGLLAYFEPSTSLATLVVGETLTANVTFKYSGGTGVAATGDFRVGLLYSNGNGTAFNDGASTNPRPNGEAIPAARISSDNFSLTSGGNTPRGYSGYLVDATAATTTSSNTLAFWRRDGGEGKSQQWLGPTSSDLAANPTFSTIGNAGGGTVGAIANNGTTYVASLAVTRTSATVTTLTYTVTTGGGTTTVMTYSTTETSATPLTSFDTFVMLSTYNASLAVTDFNVTKTSAPPTILTQPAAQTVALGANATFTVAADGTAPLTYQWSKDGTTLANGGSISGADTGTLTIANAGTADQGSYTVAVTNPYGSVTSAGATLTTLVAPTLTWANPAAITYGTALDATQLNATATVSGTFVYAPAAGTVLNAGTQQTLSVTFTPTDTTKYVPATATVKIDVNQATAQVALNGLAATYDGTAKAVTATTTPTGLNVTITYDGAPTAPTAAGNHPVVATVNDANYTGGATGTLVISQATATVQLSGLTATYDGTAKAVTAMTDPAGLSVAITYAGSGTAPSGAGSYPVVATVTDANYAGSATGTLVIGKATATVQLGGLAATYDGSGKMASATTTPSGLAVGITYNGSATLPVAAGSYAVVATVSDANYSGSATGTLVVGKATATVQLSGLGATYDGAAKAATATTTPQGLGTTLTYDGSGTTPTNAGSYAVVATVNDANYAGSASGTLVIGKATATVQLSGLTPSYDGAPKAAAATTTPTGLTVALTYNGATTAPSAAGSYAVVATVSDANYAGSATGTLAIGKSTATVQLAGLTATYDGTAKMVTAATTPADLKVGITYAGSSTAPTSAGSYAIVATIDDTNYAGSAQGTLAIAKADQKVTFAALPATVQVGVPFSISATASSGLTAMTYSVVSGNATVTGGNGITIADTGTVTLRATQAGDTNYNAATADVAVTAAKQGQTIAFTPPTSLIASAAPVTLTATATSGLPVTFALVSGPATLAGATLTLTGDTGTVTVRASQAGNGTYAAAPDVEAAITVTPATVKPQITTQPQSQTVEVGAAVSLTVVATGTPAPVYQWWKDSQPISGATSATFTIATAQLTDAGSYTVLVSNSAGQVTSSAAALTVKVHSYAGVYFGKFSSGADWALNINADNTGTFISYLPDRQSAIVLTLTINPDGTFDVTGSEIRPTATTARAAAVTTGEAGTGVSPRLVSTSFTLSGQITDNGVIGQITGLGETFQGTADATSGSAAAVAGLYTASELGTSQGSTYTIIGASGQAVVVTTTANVVAGGAGTVNNSGQVTVTSADTTQITVTVTAASQSVSASVTPAGSTTPITFAGVADTVTPSTRIVNLSVRGDAGKGDATLILGFVVGGSGTQDVLVRGIGPGLVPQGVPASLILPDPRLKLFNNLNGSLLAQNDDWSGSADLATEFQQVGAFPLPANSKDSALAISLAPGPYTAYATSIDSTTGIALIEVYDAKLTGSTRLVNVSARGVAKTGDDVMIVGFVLAGNAPKQVLIRGVGPSLVAQGVPAGSVLADPQIALYSGSTAIATNDNWGGTAELKAASTTVGAYPLNGDTSKDAAMLVTLQPGIYTVHATGVNATTGVVLLEIYDVQ